MQAKNKQRKEIEIILESEVDCYKPMKIANIESNNQY